MVRACVLLLVYNLGYCNTRHNARNAPLRRRPTPATARAHCIGLCQCADASRLSRAGANSDFLVSTFHGGQMQSELARFAEC